MALSRLDRHVSFHDAPIGIGTPIRMTRHCYMTMQHDVPIVSAPRSRRPAIFIAMQRNHVQCSEMRIGRDVTSRSTLGAILLFTMSDIAHLHQAVRPGDGSGIVFYGRAKASTSPRHARESKLDMIEPGKSRSSCVKQRLLHQGKKSQLRSRPIRQPHAIVVEPDGIEPTTSCLQSRRSPN
jgi:hypothetical protein